MSNSILHVDVDEFVAAVEVLRRPELVGRPVVVGGRGDPTKRGVVSTASYEARRYGVHSGMPLRTAVRRCPQATFIPVDRGAYESASAGVMRVLSGFTDALEVWGWDEAFLAVRDDASSIAHRIQEAVAKETGLACSIGIGDNKLRAKIASGLAKPAGIYRLTAREWFEVMGEHKVEDLWGIGRKTARRLAELGIGTANELAAADEDELTAAFGARTGPRLAMLARGEDRSPVDVTPRRARSRSLELTFDEDVDEAVKIESEVRRMATELARHIAGSDRLVTGVTVKVRFAPFTTTSRGNRLQEPTADVEVIVAAAERALARFTLDRPVRLVGVKVDLD